jgi:hypothetical protein
VPHNSIEQFYAAASCVQEQSKRGHAGLSEAVAAVAAFVPHQILRFSLVDPWMHDKNDGFPLLYIRSHAARLPGR